MYAPLLVVGFGLALACSKEQPPVAEEARAAAPAAAVPVAPRGQDGEASAIRPAMATAALANRVAEANFELTLTAPGTYEVGKPGNAEIVLVAKDPFKVNDQYPYKFKVKEARGLKLEGTTIGKDRVKLEKKRATLTIPFVPEQSGKQALTGQFSFSVCTEEKCLIEKRDLSLVVDVK
ncbi:MAG TPA: hypothetical protein VKY73_21205 [Polyangiaceae bacterium]|nr:hypothetical protein [Polyangiaceae bacterium]